MPSKKKKKRKNNGNERVKRREEQRKKEKEEQLKKEKEEQLKKEKEEQLKKEKEEQLKQEKMRKHVGESKEMDAAERFLPKSAAMIMRDGSVLKSRFKEKDLDYQTREDIENDFIKKFGNDKQKKALEKKDSNPGFFSRLGKTIFGTNSTEMSTYRKAGLSRTEAHRKRIKAAVERWEYNDKIYQNNQQVEAHEFRKKAKASLEDAKTEQNPGAANQQQKERIDRSRNFVRDDNEMSFSRPKLSLDAGDDVEGGVVGAGIGEKRKKREIEREKVKKNEVEGRARVKKVSEALGVGGFNEKNDKLVDNLIQENQKPENKKNLTFGKKYKEAEDIVAGKENLTFGKKYKEAEDIVAGKEGMHMSLGENGVDVQKGVGEKRRQNEIQIQQESQALEKQRNIAELAEQAKKANSEKSNMGANQLTEGLDLSENEKEAVNSKDIKALGRVLTTQINKLIAFKLSKALEPDDELLVSFLPKYYEISRINTAVSLAILENESAFEDPKVLQMIERYRTWAERFFNPTDEYICARLEIIGNDLYKEQSFKKASAYAEHVGKKLVELNAKKDKSPKDALLYEYFTHAIRPKGEFRNAFLLISSIKKVANRGKRLNRHFKVLEKWRAMLAKQDEKAEKDSKSPKVILQEMNNQNPLPEIEIENEKDHIDSELILQNYEDNKNVVEKLENILNNKPPVKQGAHKNIPVFKNKREVLVNEEPEKEDKPPVKKEEKKEEPVKNNLEKNEPPVIQGGNPPAKKEEKENIINNPPKKIVENKNEEEDINKQLHDIEKEIDANGDKNENEVKQENWEKGLENEDINHEKEDEKMLNEIYGASYEEKKKSVTSIFKDYKNTFTIEFKKREKNVISGNYGDFFAVVEVIAFKMISDKKNENELHNFIVSARKSKPDITAVEITKEFWEMFVCEFMLPMLYDLTKEEAGDKDTKADKIVEALDVRLAGGKMPVGKSQLFDRLKEKVCVITGLKN